MQFYHDIVTDKSFHLLRGLKSKFSFTLIGGWAVFLYTQAMKSKDIDIIVDYGELSEFRQDYVLSKNERLKKYEIKQGEVDVDIYLPHYSDIGIPVERVSESSVSRGGFKVPQLEVLFLLKLYAYSARRGSVKGKKDEMDIFSLGFLPEFNWNKYKKLVAEFSFSNYHELFLSLLSGTQRVPELQINDQKMAKQRKLILTAVS
ncbi:MAG: hypothetical protein AAB963_01290 [Patescibacteria group bacterium]